MKRVIIGIFIAFIVCVGLFNPSHAEDNSDFIKSQLGLVESFKYVDTEINALNGQGKNTKQLVTVKLLTGENKGETVILDNMLTGNPAYDIIVNKGNKVILHQEITPENKLEFFITDIQRSPIIIALIGIFGILLLIVGRKKGLYSLLSIFVTCWLIFYALSPMILYGVNPIFATLIICIISTLITIYSVGGINQKSTSAISGTVASIIFASFLAVMTIKVARLTGFSNESCLFLYSLHPELDFQGLAVSAVIIATLGAVMDVSMSIASAINEFFIIDNTLKVKSMFKSGMNVGRDVIGTMANTLILVYLGGALPLVLLSQNIDLQKFFNLNQVVTEIAAAVIGSISLVLCVPMTAIIAATLIRMKKNDIDDIMIEKDKSE